MATGDPEEDPVAQIRAQAQARIRHEVQQFDLNRDALPWLPTKAEYAVLTADGVAGDRDAHGVVIAWWYWRAFMDVGHLRQQALDLLRNAITTWRAKKVGLVAPPSGIRLATTQERQVLR